MKYLCLKFRNAGLILSDDKHFIKDSTGHGKSVKHVGHDMKTPIPYTLLSNILHKLCGEIPVPSKRQTFLKRIKLFDEIAKKSYVNYNIKPIFNDKGRVINAERFITSKYAYNSHQQVKTYFTLHDGTVKCFDGRYTWCYLRKIFSEKENFDNLCSFLSNIIGDECQRYTMPQLITKLSFYWKNDSFNEKVDNFLKESPIISSTIKMPWKQVLFGRKATGSNTSYNTKTPLLYGHGIAKIVYVSGDIICPIDDERVIQALRNNGGVATILEGGLIYITGLENYEPVPNFREKYEKIFVGKNAESFDLENVTE